MQLEHLIVTVVVLMCLYQLWRMLTQWIRDLPVPPDPWDAILSLWRKDAVVPATHPPSDAGMKKLLTARDFSGIDVCLLKGLLEQEGIPCMIKNEYLLIAMGDLPPVECYQELWLLDAADYPLAKEILDAWRTPQLLPTGDDAG